MRHGLQTRIIYDRVAGRLARLYGDEGGATMKRLKLLLSRYDDALPIVDPESVQRWTEADNLLITYGDMVRAPGEAPLRTLGRFCREHLAGVIDTVHILPFCPYSSDDGFSVIDYQRVKPEWGSWDDVESLGEDFRLMFDLVLNHCSSRSGWFRDYLMGIAPSRYYFHEMEPGVDLSAVTRPRPSPLLTKVRTRAGDRWVWTTFSADQVDLNFANPDVLLEFLDILLLYVSKGARIVRLDAIAYLWKRLGTTCIHLPETHEVVKLMRDVLEIAAPHVVLLTETNVPHAENISYFGDGDEAHMVYNFSLPPLVLHALQSGSGKHLTRWAASQPPPPPGCTYLNFTASHDGVGVRPLEGLLATKQIQELGDLMKVIGGHVSEKSNPDGTRSPYEINITYFDAMSRSGDEDPSRKVNRFLCSQLIALGLRGVPAVYFNSLVAGPNDHQGVKNLGYPRAINRHKWDESHLTSLLNDPRSPSSQVFDEYRRVIRIRSQQPAFHPDADQVVHNLGDELFAFSRVSSTQTVLCVSNLSGSAVTADLARTGEPLAGRPWRDLLSGDHTVVPGPATLDAYQTRWIVADHA